MGVPRVKSCHLGSGERIMYSMYVTTSSRSTLLHFRSEVSKYLKEIEYLLYTRTTLHRRNFSYLGKEGKKGSDDDPHIPPSTMLNLSFLTSAKYMIFWAPRSSFESSEATPLPTQPSLPRCGTEATQIRHSYLCVIASMHPMLARSYMSILISLSMYVQ